jgi:hypothetical protein
MVCMSSNTLAPRKIAPGLGSPDDWGSKWYAVYVETRREKPDRINPQDSEALRQNIRLAESLGATVVRVKAARPVRGKLLLGFGGFVLALGVGDVRVTRWRCERVAQDLDHTQCVDEGRGK